MAASMCKPARMPPQQLFVLAPQLTERQLRDRHVLNRDAREIGDGDVARTAPSQLGVLDHLSQLDEVFRPDQALLQRGGRVPIL